MSKYISVIYILKYRVSFCISHRVQRHDRKGLRKILGSIQGRRAARSTEPSRSGVRRLPALRVRLASHEDSRQRTARSHAVPRAMAPSAIESQIIRELAVLCWTLKRFAAHGNGRSQ
jgi:hypothetical protein